MGTLAKLDRAALKEACLEVARGVVRKRGPIEVGVLEELASRLFEIALRHEAYIVASRHNPNLVTRAVRYLAWSHPIPPTRDPAERFSNMLAVLVELACPTVASDLRNDGFYEDIERGIGAARSGLSEDGQG